MPFCSVLDGYNVTIMAYGQTGSGKTHTMEGPDNNPGVNTRALGELFRCGGSVKGREGKTYTVEGADNNPGVNMRALGELFRCVGRKCEGRGGG